MSGGNGRAEAHPSGDRLYLNCPRCGLSILIVPRAAGPPIEHCPRCIARSRALVELFASPLPTAELYGRGHAPRAQDPTGDDTRRDPGTAQPGHPGPPAAR